MLIFLPTLFLFALHALILIRTPVLLQPWPHSHISRFSAKLFDGVLASVPGLAHHAFGVLLKLSCQAA